MGATGMKSWESSVPCRQNECSCCTNIIPYRSVGRAVCDDIDAIAIILQYNDISLKRKTVIRKRQLHVVSYNYRFAICCNDVFMPRKCQNCLGHEMPNII